MDSCFSGLTPSIGTIGTNPASHHKSGGCASYLRNIGCIGERSAGFKCKICAKSQKASRYHKEAERSRIEFERWCAGREAIKSMDLYMYVEAVPISESWRELERTIGFLPTNVHLLHFMYLSREGGPAQAAQRRSASR
mmetsp:Transcript_17567/g.37152  ORF Transcript_17567/g.37152 Transcript_17567/m.37152 type:complete len:138 (-) Transcript_17567:2283-2696(-)